MGPAGSARRWLRWLGLCFWAAGAAAARGECRPGGGTWRVRSGTARRRRLSEVRSDLARRADGQESPQTSEGTAHLPPKFASAAILQVAVTRAPTPCLASPRQSCGLEEQPVCAPALLSLPPRRGRYGLAPLARSESSGRGSGRVSSAPLRRPFRSRGDLPDEITEPCATRGAPWSPSPGLALAEAAVREPGELCLPR